MRGGLGTASMLIVLSVLLVRVYSETIVSVVGSRSSDNINKVSLLSGIVEDNRRRYCEHWGYTCSMSTFEGNDYTAARGAKLALMTNTLHAAADGDRVLLLDADVLIVDPRFPLFSAVAEGGADLGLCQDYRTEELQYQSGVIYSTVTKSTRDFFRNLHESHKVHKSGSDQKVLNEALQEAGNQQHVTVQDLPRIVYNAFPRFEQKEWNLMQLPVGDEDPVSSKLVHFAGVYGGADNETGETDPVVLLISAREFAVRHLRFLNNLMMMEATTTTSESGIRRLQAHEEHTGESDDNQGEDAGAAGTLTDDTEHEETEEEYLEDMKKHRGGQGEHGVGGVPDGEKKKRRKGKGKGKGKNGKGKGKGKGKRGKGKGKGGEKRIRKYKSSKSAARRRLEFKAVFDKQWQEDRHHVSIPLQLAIDLTSGLEKSLQECIRVCFTTYTDDVREKTALACIADARVQIEKLRMVE